MRGALRGFAVGSLALIALYVGLQPNAATAAEAGGNALVGMLRRALSADVAGLPRRGGAPVGGETVGAAVGAWGGAGSIVGSAVGSLNGGGL